MDTKTQSLSKALLVCATVLATGLAYFGAAECYENTAPIWIACTFMGGYMTAVVLALTFDAY